MAVVVVWVWVVGVRGLVGSVGVWACSPPLVVPLAVLEVASEVVRVLVVVVVVIVGTGSVRASVRCVGRWVLPVVPLVVVALVRVPPVRVLDCVRWRVQVVPSAVVVGVQRKAVPKPLVEVALEVLVRVAGTALLA